MQGKLSDIKASYRTETYLIETKREEDTLFLIQTFDDLKRLNRNQLRFHGKEETLFTIMQFMVDHKLGIFKLEREEPTLETWFMEVVEK